MKSENENWNKKNRRRIRIIRIRIRNSDWDGCMYACLYLCECMEKVFMKQKKKILSKITFSGKKTCNLFSPFSYFPKDKSIIS